MTKVERLTYANYVEAVKDEYPRIHDLVEAYGGMVKQVHVESDEDSIIIFYTMQKQQKQEFEKELMNK